MKKLFQIQFLLLFFLYSSSYTVQAQEYITLEEGKSMEINGISISFKILNFTKKEVRNKGEMDRYEVLLSALNKNACDMSIRLTGREKESQTQNKFPIANFRCLNATGARLTAKDGDILPEIHRVSYKYFIKDNEGKNIEKTAEVTAGFYFRAGALLENKVIFIVPIGEKPRIEARVLKYE